MLRKIRNFLIFIIIVGILTAYIDYTRMMGGNSPIFNISTYNENKHYQFYRGLFYQASRKTKVNNLEPLEDSSNIKYYVLTVQVDVPSQFKEDKFEFSLKTTETSSCSGPSQLYYADKDIKVYTYCIDSIDALELGQKKEKPLLTYLEKDNGVIEDLIQNISFMGLYTDDSTEIYKTIDDSFSNNGISVFRCNRDNVKDIYIAPYGTTVKDDFCIYKDDDFKFISTVSEEKPDAETTEAKEKEIFYEDENYTYEFDEKKSDRIFVTAPAVRLSPEKRYTLKEVLNNNLLTIDELEKKGLKFNKVAKS